MKKWTTKSKHKSAADMVHALRAGIESLPPQGDMGGRRGAKAVENVTKTLQSMVAVVGGPGPTHPGLMQDMGRIAQERGFLMTLVGLLKPLGSEGKKAVASIVGSLLQWEHGGTNPVVDHLCREPEPLWILLRGYELRETALPSGGILRDCARFQSLATTILNSRNFYDLFRYVDTNLFDVSTDAFCTLKDLLTRHKVLSAEFLDQNYDQFFDKFHELIKSDNYVTRRQSLELLAKLILERHNYTIMIRYISDKENLRLIMRMFQQPSRTTQFECFHVFKVFVANPTKPTGIREILRRNREEIIKYFKNFQDDRGDEQFINEKEFIIKQMKEL